MVPHNHSTTELPPGGRPDHNRHCSGQFTTLHPYNGRRCGVSNSSQASLLPPSALPSACRDERSTHRTAHGIDRGSATVNYSVSSGILAHCDVR
jgi:hypothetical protein